MLHPSFSNTTLRHRSFVHGLAAYMYRYGTGRSFSQSSMGNRMSNLYYDNMSEGFKKYYK